MSTAITDIDVTATRMLFKNTASDVVGSLRLQDAKVREIESGAKIEMYDKLDSYTFSVPNSLGLDFESAIAYIGALKAGVSAFFIDPPMRSDGQEVIDKSTLGTDRPMQPGRCANLNGTDQDFTTELTTSMSFVYGSVWFKWTGSSPTTYRHVFAKGNRYAAGPYEFAVVYRPSSDAIIVSFDHGSGRNDLIATAVVDPTTNWVNVQFLIKDGEQKLWINDSLEDSDTESFSTGIGSSYPVSIGRGNADDSTSRRWEGLIFGAQLFEEEPTSDQRSAIYQQGIKPKSIYPGQPEPEHRWYLNETGNGPRFDSGSATTKYSATPVTHSLAMDYTGDDVPYNPQNLDGYDEAADFNGVDQEVEVVNALTMVAGTPYEYEVSFLIRSSKSYHALIMSGTFGSAYGVLIDNNQKIRVYGKGSSPLITSGDDALSLNTIHTIKVSYDGTTTTLFVDGVSIATTTSAPTYNETNADLFFGRQSSGSYALDGYIFDGYFDVDGVRIADKPDFLSDIDGGANSPTLARLPLDTNGQSLIRETPTYTGRVPRDLTAVESPTLNLNGTQYVDVFDSEAVPAEFLAINKNVTIIAFVKPSTVTGSGGTWWQGHTIVELRQEAASPNAHVPFSFGITASNIGFGCGGGNTAQSNNVSGATTLVADTEYVLSAIIDDQDYKLRVDSVEDASGTFANATGDRQLTDNGNMQIGVRSRDSGLKDDKHFAGNITRVVIYGTTLTDDEVLYVETRGQQGTAPSGTPVFETPFSNKGMDRIRDIQRKAYYPIIGYAESMWDKTQSKDHEHLNNGCDVGLNFIGAEHVQFGSDSDSLFELQNFSIELRFRKTTTGAFETLIGCNQASSSIGYAGWFVAVNTSGDLQFSCVVGASSQEAPILTGNYEDGEWHYIRATKNGTSLTIEDLDTAASNTETLSNGTVDWTTSQDFKFGIGGRWNDSSNAWVQLFNGQIADIEYVNLDTTQEILNARCVDGANGKKIKSYNGSSSYTEITGSESINFGDATSDEPFSIVVENLEIDSFGAGKGGIVSKRSNNTAGTLEYELKLASSGELIATLFDNTTSAYIRVTSDASLATSEKMSVEFTYDGSGLATQTERF